MIADIVSWIFLPVIYPMELVFNLLWGVTGSAGGSIILLALIISILTIPLKRKARQAEDKFFALKRQVDADVKEKAAGLKGERRFEVIEKVYEGHSYHPIKSIIAGASFVVVLPFLISAIFIFGDADFLKQVSFLFVRDLSVQDGLLFGLNFLPILMLVLGIGEAVLRWRGQRDQLFRYLIISIILFVLVYPLASGLITYWISMNFWTAMIFYFANRQVPQKT